MCRCQQTREVYQTFCIESSFAGLRLFEPRKVVPLSEGAPGHDESQSKSEAQIPVDRRCFISKKARATRVFGFFQCATYRAPVFMNMLAFGRNQVRKKCLAISSKKVTQETRNSKLEGVKKLNLAVKIEHVFDLTVPCILISFTVWIGCFGGKGRRKNERNDRVHIEEDIECHRQQHLDQTSTYLDMLRCNTLQPGWPCVVHKCWVPRCPNQNPKPFNLKPFIYLEHSGALVLGNTMQHHHFIVMSNVEKPGA